MPVSDAMHAGDINRRQEQMERKLRELSAARTLESASVGAGGIRLADGGSLTVEGGNLVVRNPDGVEVVWFGDLSVGGARTRGWIFRHDTGERAFALGGHTGRQYWALYDAAGTQVVASDAASGHGLAKPYIPYRLVPSFAAQQDGTSLWPSTDSSTPVKLMQGVNPIWHPKLSIGIAMGGGGGGTGHWRVDVNGSTVVADQTSSGSHVVSIPGWGDDITPGEEAGIDVYGWVTGGPGRVYLQCDRLYGRQT